MDWDPSTTPVVMPRYREPYQEMTRRMVAEHIKMRASVSPLADASYPTTSVFSPRDVTVVQSSAIANCWTALCTVARSDDLYRVDCEGDSRSVLIHVYRKIDEFEWEI